ncbi:hypothetical protein [Acidilobus sp.]|uniref:hypothetical protein n=1 Tax=Acidilobus sp. TaxID=1872109 RepID=UPI003D0002EF
MRAATARRLVEEAVTCVAELGASAERLAGLGGRAAALAADVVSVARATTSAARARGLAAPRPRPPDPGRAMLELASAASSCSPLRGGGPALVWSLVAVAGPELEGLLRSLGPRVEAEEVVFDVLGLREVGSVRSSGRDVAVYGFDFPDWGAVAGLVDLGVLDGLPWSPDQRRPGVEAAPLCRAVSPGTLTSALASAASRLGRRGAAGAGPRDLLLAAYAEVVGRPSVGCDEAMALASRLASMSPRRRQRK